jgi:Ala-tRNA(Pro) deacylase
MKYLGVAPGSVTVLGLVNDVDEAVELYVDRDLWNAAQWRCHPLVNTATLVIARTDLERFFAHTGHRPRVVDIA